jgi:hypothetical protein
MALWVAALGIAGDQLAAVFQSPPEELVHVWTWARAGAAEERTVMSRGIRMGGHCLGGFAGGKSNVCELQSCPLGADNSNRCLSEGMAVDLQRDMKLDRRAWARTPRTGSAMAAFFDEDGALSLTRVELTDESQGGLGLLCPVEVPRGVRFSLYSTGIPLPHTTGVVARCEALGEEFRIGLRCDQRMAA